ncbi:alpha/beta hydrolase [Nocardia sp. NBC_01503]|uniref:alpha/beta hydrolase n=1 Tax=Nocardia sp. NBC_01503 TaxID=2975997 RepID=UPI002E7B501C|nr:alpha/beta hydrolase [Nocardia sp. NBC_01503]WTL31197.1 alpha/beta hydrolase [Nocardia sp. NBC_01503]
MRSFRTCVRLVALLIAVAAPVGCASGPPTARGLPARLQGQVIGWHDCRTGADDEIGGRLAAAGAQCGEFLAPVNYDDPGGASLSIAVARRVAGDPAHRLGTLVVETGGPGPSRDGVTMIVDGPEGGHAARTELAERYDLVGMDPRFFGASTPLECGWTTGEYLGIAQAAPTDRASFDRTVRTARDLAARCEPSRELLPYASTRNVARDLDLLRTLLGESEISYLGWSWGTYLGAVYSQMFGDRVDRIVLDSPLDPRAPGPDLTRRTATATRAALADWARWAAERDSEFGLGATEDVVLGAIDAMAAAVAAHPVTRDGVTITGDMVPGLLLTVDDSDEYYTTFGRQVRALYDASRGDTADSAPELAAKLALYSDTTVAPEFGFSATVANQCADRAARGVDDYFTDVRRHLADEPMFGALARHLTPCAVWPVGPAEPATEIANRVPALLIGAAGDPVAPAAGQQALRQALSGARVVTLEGAFRHGVYLAEPAGCVDAVVERYLLDGVLPGDDMRCRRGES